MPRRRLRTTVLLLPVVLALTACGPGAAPARPVAGSVPPVSATLTPRTAAPVPTSLATVPPPGSVVLRPGPFDDRLALTGTSLRDGTVRTALAVTSDVSEVLVVELQADYYDASGRLLGSRRTDHEDPDVVGDVRARHEPVQVVLAAPAAVRTRVASAVLSVPVLVNE